MSKNSFVIIVGAPKAGTSFLFENLARHPEINASRKKETRFFQAVNFGDEIKSFNEYLEYFDCNRSDSWFLEASPGYFYGAPNICKTMNKYLGNVRYILILRNPIQRFISYYQHLKKRMLIDTASLNEFVVIAIKRFKELESDKGALESDYYARCLRAGFYEEYLSHWIKETAGSQIKILFFEEIKNESSRLLKEICDWLSIESGFFANRKLNASNESFVYQNKLFHQLALWFSQKLSFYLPRSVRASLRKRYAKLNKGESQEMSLKNYDALSKIYSERNKNLGVLLNSMGYKNLPNWVVKINVSE